MRLRAFHVRLFRNIIDSGRIEIDNIACLVGKNEAGKSALLHALHALNPAKPDAHLDLLDEYPRWLKKEHEISGTITDAVPITAEFELSDDELNELQIRFGVGVLTSKTILAYRRYSSQRMELEAAINYDAFIAPFIASLAPDLQGALLAPATSDELIKQLTALAAGDESEDAAPADVAGAAHDALTRLHDVLGEGNLRGAVESYLRERIPRTFYFSTYAQLSGRYNLDEVFQAVRGASDSEDVRSAADFLRLAEVVPGAVEDWDFEASNAELESVSSLLTKRVREQWQQSDHLRLRVTLEAQRASAGAADPVKRYLQFRVEDTRHDFSNALDRRSTGFRWFVSFIASFMEFEKEQNLILLLDEPGLSLHARAQVNLLGAIESLADTHQVLYSTHSPFMVRSDALERVRVIEDQGPKRGSVALTDGATVADPDTLFPLQVALGNDVARSLLVGGRTVLVQDVTDFLFVTMMSDHLRSRRRAALPADCRVIPLGSLPAVSTAIALLGSHLDAVALVDDATSLPVLTEQVFAIDNFSVVRGAGIEDLFTPNEYLRFYNAAFKRSLKLGQLNGSDRIVARIARVAGDFRPADVAQHVLRSLPKATASLSAGTLDRFENLMTAITTALPAR